MKNYYFKPSSLFIVVIFLQWFCFLQAQTIQLQKALGGLSYPTTPQTYTVGVAIIPLTPPKGGPVYYRSLQNLQNINTPNGLTLDSSGNVYVAAETLLWKISKNNVLTTLAGSGSYGTKDGTGSSASFGNLNGAAVDNVGNVYVTDADFNKIRKITPTGIVTTLAGSGAIGSADGAGVAASFNYPTGIAVDSSGNIYVADTGNNIVRKITPAGIVTTFAGSGISGDINGVNLSARFNRPTGIAIDISGNIYIADWLSNKIRKITAGVVSTFAGRGGIGDVDGPSNVAIFNSPIGLTVDINGNVYVADRDNNKIRKITPEGVVSTFVSSKTVSNDGSFLKNPTGVALNASGTIYLSDLGNNKIRQIIEAFSISPQLPTGLNFDSSTGIISGIPTTVSPQTTYIVTATNANVFNTFNIKISIIGVKPAINFTAPPLYTVGTAVPPLTPINTGSPALSYSITPNLSTGLSFDTKTGIISGTPLVAKSETLYTVTATNNYGTDTATVLITINSVLSIEDITFKQMMIYPNPTISKMFFDNSIYNFEYVAVVDSLGKEVAKIKFSALLINQEIDLRGLVAGIYILKFSNGKISKSAKVIKQ
ncbi:putative Ig domain-containing protein [Flavobacterium sp.]|uniref:putative Ig domain-containing protein n=1 Tax=Flavobacterium sp. TaxID=239 RepID=UPI00286D8C41|nr:putative Ig domain-containing protein [Flavobacterium sp.]